MNHIFEVIEEYDCIEDSNIEIVYASDCKKIFSLDRNAYYNNTLKNILPMLNKLLTNIDDKNKIEIHKLISSNFYIRSRTKLITLFPGYASIYNLYKNNDCLFTDIASKLLFNIELSINKNISISKILSNNDEFEYNENIDKYVNGWCYLIFKDRDNFLNNKIKMLIKRICIYNLTNPKYMIPSHFKIKKNIDVYMYIVLKFLSDIITTDNENIKILNYLKEKEKDVNHYERYLFDKLIKRNNNRTKFYLTVIKLLKTNIDKLHI